MRWRRKDKVPSRFILHTPQTVAGLQQRGESGTVPEGDVLDPAIATRLRRDDAGLVAVVVRQHDSKEVLMLAWMDDEALRRTLTTGRATYWSRSRQRYWIKGETSGHHQFVRSAALDCDGDAILLDVEQIGPACHTGARTCFSHPLPIGSPE